VGVRCQDFFHHGIGSVNTQLIHQFKGAFAPSQPNLCAYIRIQNIANTLLKQGGGIIEHGSHQAVIHLVKLTFIDVTVKRPVFFEVNLFAQNFSWFEKFSQFIIQGLLGMQCDRYTGHVDQQKWPHTDIEKFFKSSINCNGIGNSFFKQAERLVV